MWLCGPAAVVERFFNVTAAESCRYRRLLPDCHICRYSRHFLFATGPCSAPSVTPRTPSTQPRSRPLKIDSLVNMACMAQLGCILVGPDSLRCLVSQQHILGTAAPSQPDCSLQRSRFAPTKSPMPSDPILSPAHLAADRRRKQDRLRPPGSLSVSDARFVIQLVEIALPQHVARKMHLQKPDPRLISAQTKHTEQTLSPSSSSQSLVGPPVSIPGSPPVSVHSTITPP